MRRTSRFFRVKCHVEPAICAGLALAICLVLPAMALAQNANVYVTNNISNTVSAINTITHNVAATVSGFNSPVGLALTPDGLKGLCCK